MKSLLPLSAAFACIATLSGTAAASDDERIISWLKRAHWEASQLPPVSGVKFAYRRIILPTPENPVISITTPTAWIWNSSNWIYSDPQPTDEKSRWTEGVDWIHVREQSATATLMNMEVLITGMGIEVSPDHNHPLVMIDPPGGYMHCSSLMDEAEIRCSTLFQGGLRQIGKHLTKVRIIESSPDSFTASAITEPEKRACEIRGAWNPDLGTGRVTQIVLQANDGEHAAPTVITVKGWNWNEDLERDVASHMIYEDGASRTTTILSLEVIEPITRNEFDQIASSQAQYVRAAAPGERRWTCNFYMTVESLILDP